MATNRKTAQTQAPAKPKPWHTIHPELGAVLTTTTGAALRTSDMAKGIDVYLGLDAEVRDYLAARTALLTAVLLDDVRRQLLRANHYAEFGARGVRLTVSALNEIAENTDEIVENTKGGLRAGAAVEDDDEGTENAVGDFDGADGDDGDDDLPPPSGGDDGDDDEPNADDDAAFAAMERTGTMVDTSATPEEQGKAAPRKRK